MEQVELFLARVEPPLRLWARAASAAYPSSSDGEPGERRGTPPPLPAMSSERVGLVPRHHIRSLSTASPAVPARCGPSVSARASRSTADDDPPSVRVVRVVVAAPVRGSDERRTRRSPRGRLAVVRPPPRRGSPVRRGGSGRREAAGLRALLHPPRSPQRREEALLLRGPSLRGGFVASGRLFGRAEPERRAPPPVGHPSLHLGRLDPRAQHLHLVLQHLRRGRAL
eukprot:1181300-Prorocentrum_minimum.AAC.1